jgi:hypothetical protein
LSGKLITKNNQQEAQQIFESKKVTYEEFIKDPLKILSDKSLLVRIKDELFEWEYAGAILMCKLAFNKDLPNNVKHDMLPKKN